MKNFNGRILFLDRADINTDEIIPAHHLTEIAKEAMKPHLLEGLKIDGFNPRRDIPGKSVIVARSNFGCGSSREHAPWALEANGINIVIAESFARIFRQNMYNCGMLAVELSHDAIDSLFRLGAKKDVTIETDFDANQFIVSADGEEERIGFVISDFDRELVRDGGWLEYAEKKY
ncbi:MAG: 3-isopropylmalate dehydratase small subunit [Spirochaetes bacterium]|nr:3-isopropylmalate dehydratase small subunit [Spirochaetota bacterium]